MVRADASSRLLDAIHEDDAGPHEREQVRAVEPPPPALRHALARRTVANGDSITFDVLSVPVHAGKDLGKGLLARLLKEAGLK